MSAADSSGYKGTYYYSLDRGVHVIEWTVMENNEENTYSREFSIDNNDPYLNIVIDGDEFIQY